MAKETIYIEADDEITSVIDKVVGAEDKVVAIVLPKRASVFMSVVNMKLLKRAAQEVKKQVVLVSSERAITSIAAVAGVHVASTLSSKPTIPKRAGVSKAERISTSDFDEAIESNEKPAKTGLSAALAEKAEKTTNDEEIEIEQDETGDSIDLDNTSESVDSTADTDEANEDSKKKSKRKLAFKVPDFGSFRLKMTLAIIAILLLGAGWFVGFVIMPKATITIATDTRNQPVTFDFVIKTAATEVDVEAGVVPAKKVETEKQNKATAEATGEKNTGEKATGEVTLIAEACDTVGVPDDVPEGTGVSTGGNTYITQNDVSFSFSSFNGDCLLFTGDDSASIIAQDAGEAYNLDIETEFAVSGRSDVTASGTAEGGTSKLVKIVTAEDIKKATDQLKSGGSADATSELKTKLEEQGLQAMAETLDSADTGTKSSLAVGAEGSEVTVTQSTIYSMLGFDPAQLQTILDARVQKALEGKDDRNVRSNGFDKATYRLVTKTSKDEQTIGMQTVAIVGPQFNEEALRSDVAGKKRGEIESMLNAREGVNSVTIEYSPLWITTTPKSADKITIVINELEN